MKKLLLAYAVVAGFTFGAQAADLGAPRGAVDAVVVAPVFSWSGFYLGANIGYGWGSTRVNVTHLPTQAAFGADPYSVGLRPAGILGGVQAGYNWQMNRLVVGVEADIQASGMRQSAQFGPLPLIGGAPLAGSFNISQSRLDWFGTLRARLGVAPADRLLVYLTGGLIYGGVSYSSRSQYNGGVGDNFNYIGRASQVRAGYTLGGGVEWAFANNWTFKGEYLYFDLGRTVGIVGNPVAANPPFQTVNSFSTNGHIVRVGVNYFFSTGGSAVVARY